VNRRELIGSLSSAAIFAGCASAKATPPLDAPAQPFALDLKGAAAQGGMLVGRTLPKSKIYLGGAETLADEKGFFVVGFDHNAAASALLRVIAPNGTAIDRTLNVAPRTYDQTVVNGLPQETVTPPPEVLERIKAESARKAAGFASVAPGEGFTQPFIWPVAGRISSNWGAQRVLNGVLGRPHYGVDIAAPEGALVIAPADGVVAFAETDLFYEGGLLMIDHGQGLITLYLHLSKLEVGPGQSVKQGQAIGRVGKKGRATGPHLCWRMKWRGQNLDPSLAVTAFGGPAQPPALQP
jgi:murein DD-endopeptidase MepM/ murein hydrolase activator NlpD